MAKDIEAAAKLTASPQKTLEFMRKNLVVVTGNPVRPLRSGVQSFMLDNGLGGARLPNGKAINGYYLRPGDGSAGCFDAYWCACEADLTGSVVVGRLASLMFTVTMDGCSLGVGSLTKNGERLFSHSNARSIGYYTYALLEGQGEARAALAATRHLQQDAQEQQIRQEFKEKAQFAGHGQVTIIDPPMYRQNSEGQQVLSSTTFGVRDSGDWSVYVHKYDLSKDPPVLIGVAFVAGKQPDEQSSFCALM
jgi:hypothetical protein